MAILSFHAGAEGKVTKNNVGALTRHTQRATKEANKEHSNDNIDDSLTPYNLDIGVNGQTMDERVFERIENEYAGKRKIQKNQVVMREVITQPSADVFEGLNIEQKQEKLKQFMDDALPWFKEEFGADNVVGGSGHLDEINPHAHIGIMPMTDDGRLRQTDFFKSPKDLQRMHKDYREHMNERGWQFDTENKYEQFENVPQEKYKANAPKIEAQRQELNELDENEATIAWRKQEQQKEIDKLDEQDVTIKARKQAQEKEISELMEDDEIHEEAINRFTDQQGHNIQAHLDRREEELEEREEKLRKREHNNRIFTRDLENSFLTIASYAKNEVSHGIANKVERRGISAISSRGEFEGTIMKGVEGIAQDGVSASQVVNDYGKRRDAKKSKPPEKQDDGPELG